MDCPNCGKTLKAGETFCSACGRTIPGGAPMPESRKPDYSMFQHSDMPSTTGKTNADYLYAPTMWMYIASVFFPMLQWILIGMYVSKNQFDEARSLFFRPLIAQVVMYTIAIIIIVVACG